RSSSLRASFLRASPSPRLRTKTPRSSKACSAPPTRSSRGRSPSTVTCSRWRRTSGSCRSTARGRIGSTSVRRPQPAAAGPRCGGIAVAELALTLVLALSKQLVQAHTATVEGAYRELGLEPVRTSERVIAFQWMKLPSLFEVYGKTLGIVGYGEIGTEVSK